MFSLPGKASTRKKSEWVVTTARQGFAFQSDYSVQSTTLIIDRPAKLAGFNNFNRVKSATRIADRFLRRLNGGPNPQSWLECWHFGGANGRINEH